MQRRGALLAVLAFAGLVFGPTGARADDPGIVTLDGTAPTAANISIRSVIFDPSRFGIAGGTRYRAFGVLPPSQGTARLAQITSDDGIHWSAPQPALITDTTNANVPFVFSDSGGYFDVVFAPGGAPAMGTAQPFEIFYQVIPQIDPKTQQPSDNTTKFSSIHVASSSDGVNWTLDTALAQSGEPVVSGLASGWKTGSYGPTDVIFQPGVSGCAPAAANFPWNCKYLMAYDAYGNHSDGHARSYVGVAGSADGLTWTGRANPALCPGDPVAGSVCAASATTWDMKYVTQAHLRKLSPSSFEMYYAGGSGGVGDCFAGNEPCWSVGVATSIDGVNWSKTVIGGDPSAPAIDRHFLEAGAPDAPYTLVFPQAVDDQAITGDPRARVYYSRVSNTGVRGMFLGHTGGAPAAGPSISIASPAGVYRSTLSSNVVLYLNDASRDILMNTFQLKLDGVPVDGVRVESSTVGATTKPGLKISVSAADLNAAEGPHTLTVSVKDDGPAAPGNPATASTSFTVDRTAPSSSLTQTPAGNTPIGYQVADPGSLGTFAGTIADPGSSAWNAVAKMRAIVTNPLGETRQYVSSNARSGWRFSPDLPAHSGTWRWVAPANNSVINTLWYDEIPTIPDLFYSIPGAYKVRFAAVDLAGNEEPASAANTTFVNVL
jgi:hypothetical protein